jgi:hypothetical protein
MSEEIVSTTRKGYVLVQELDGTIVSQHADREKAISAATNLVLARPVGAELEIHHTSRVRKEKDMFTPPLPPAPPPPTEPPSPPPPPPAPPPAPASAQPLTASLQHGADDRGAGSASRREALARFDWVLWGIYRKSPTLNARAEAAIAYCRTVKPAGIHSNYSIAYELSSQTARILRITRVGTTVTVTTPAIAPNMQVGRQAYIAAAGVAAYVGLWTITAISTAVAGAHTWQFTATGGAATAADDNPCAGGRYVCSISTGYDALVKLQEENWFLRKLGTAGAQTAWTNAYSAVDMNCTDWLPVDSNGDRWVDWKAKDDDAEIFGQIAGLDYVFSDNHMDPRDDIINDSAYPAQRAKRDWKRTGALQARTDADILAAHRAGLARFAQKHRDLSVARPKSPDVKIIGNTDGSFANGAGWDDQIEAGFIEGATGASYSLATLALLVARHDAIKARLLAPALMVWHSHGPSITDYAAMRFGLCCALMRPGTYYSFGASKHDNITFYNEYELQIGAEVGGVDPSAPWSNGVWRREFANAWAFVNDTDTARTVTILAGLRRPGAADLPAGAAIHDPAVWTGAALGTSLTLGPRQGLIAMKV